MISASVDGERRNWNMSSARPLVAGAIILIVASVFRDTTLVGNSFFFREVSQGVALLLAVAYFPRSAGCIPPQALILVTCYIGVLLVGALNASAWDFVLFQIGSLAAVIFFALTWHGHDSCSSSANYRTMYKVTLYLLSAVSVGSLAAIVVAPEVAYEIGYAGEVRFRGLLSRPGGMGAFAGLLAGIAMLHRETPTGLRLVFGVAGLACLVLAGARTYWVSFAVALAASWMVYMPSLWRKARFVALAAAIVVGGLVWAGVDFHLDPVRGAVRSDSLSNLTGRTSIWENALETFGARPWFGYGLTQGSMALEANNSGSSMFSRNEVDPRAASRRTLHNGYIQAVLDSGLVGAFFYLAIVVMATLRLLKRDNDRQFVLVFYSIIFLAVANIAENIIYAASVFPSVFFWVVAMFSLCLRPNELSRRETHGPNPMLRPGARPPHP